MTLMNIKELRRRKPLPPILYHYTTSKGLLGIVEQGEIWLTHTQYLNDTKEYRHALSIVKNELRNMKIDPAFG